MSTANTCTDKHVQHVRTIKRVIIVNVVCCACMTTTIVHVCASLHVFACFNCTLGIACLLVYWYMHACLPHLEVTVHNQHWKSVLKSKFHSFVAKSSQGHFGGVLLEARLTVG